MCTVVAELFSHLDEEGKRDGKTKINLFVANQIFFVSKRREREREREKERERDTVCVFAYVIKRAQESKIILACCISDNKSLPLTYIISALDVNRS